MHTKLRLDLDRLHVESFETAQAVDGRGTVFGEAQHPSDTCVGGITCDQTACSQPTCQQYTCGAACATAADPTCGPTACRTCAYDPCH